jgi:hypothetical protein
MVNERSCQLRSHEPERDRDRQIDIKIRTLQVKVLKVQGDSLARGPKLLSIINYVIETITWKFIYTYRERCKTGPVHKRCWKWSHFTSKAHFNAFLQILKYYSKNIDVDGFNLFAYSVIWVVRLCRGVFLYTPLFSRTPKRKEVVRR